MLTEGQSQTYRKGEAHPQSGKGGGGQEAKLVPTPEKESVFF